MHRGSDANKIAIKNRIPVYLTYFTAVVDENGSLKQYRDLYGHDRRMTAALNGRPIPAGLPDNMAVSSSTSYERRAVRRRAGGNGGNPFAAIFDF
jgi:hypothetical protein